MKLTLLQLAQDIEPEVPKSTQWARENKDKVAEQYLRRKGTLDGKLISLTTQSKYRSKAKGWEHNVDKAYLKGLYEGQEGLCALSGEVMTIIGARGTDEHWKSLSIDRIDSTLGYIEGNIQLVCTAVNCMKRNMTDEMFYDFCLKVVENGQ